MPQQILYIHYDTVSNYVLSKGIVNQNRHTLLRRMPENLLLIKGNRTAGTYDSHTGFRIIRGQEKVKEFIYTGAGKPEVLGSWIDFVNIDMLHQLTPVEISEILYIGHAHTYLHSPFYYKLQNNYIFLSMPNGFTKLYYRYLEEFHEQFAESVTERMRKKVNEKKRFFQKERNVSPFPVERVKELIPAFREGAVISFRQMTIENGIYSAPMFIAEDNLAKVESYFDERHQFGRLVYDCQKDTWELESRVMPYEIRV